MNESKPMDWRGRKVVIVGGSGFLGGVCARHFAGLGAGVVVVSRTRPKYFENRVGAPYRWVDWEAGNTAWAEALTGAEAVVNLVGRSVDCRKTPSHCDEILRSRVDSVRRLGGVLASMGERPLVWVQAGTAHLYGDPPEVRLGDDAAPGWGFAPYVGRVWESSFREALPAGMRGVVLRTSFVLDANGGALPVLVRLVRHGLGGRAGHGRQGFSWIHACDFAAVVERVIEDPSVGGSVNVTAPGPVSQAEFMRVLRETLGMPFGLPAPAAVVRFGARWILDTDPELVLEGRYVVPERLLGLGFAFRYPELRGALTDLLGSAA